jgi:spore coat polysaccharide biosynthesis protein SpsF
MKNKKKIFAIIQARMGSSRLPGKVMMEIKGTPLLGLLIERIKDSKLLDGIILATSTDKKDQAIENFCKKNNINCFRGNENDVLDRVLSAAKKYNAEIIVQITGDCPLVDSKLIDDIIRFYFNNNYDYISTFNTRTFPVGYDVRVFSVKLLDEISQITKDPEDREHVSIYIIKHPEKYKIGSFIAPKGLNHPEYRLVVDEKEDFELVKKIFENFSTFTFSIKDVTTFLEKNPSLALINKNITHKQFKLKEL